MTPSVWIIDDDKSIRWVLEKALTRAGISYASFTNADDALNALYDTLPKVILSDIRMPGTDGLKFLATVKAEHPTLPVIVMTAHSDLDSAVAAFQGGAFEYLPKPFDVDQAVQLVERALGEAERDNAGPDAMDATPVMLGQAPAMQDVFRAIGRLSQSSVTVLITGESGSGKELVATTVVEVGVDLPRLRHVVVVHPERFGLSMLHQIRGRVARQGGQGRCDLLAPAPLSESARERLEVLERTQDGFEVAARDLALRGFGDLRPDGTSQSGGDESVLFGRPVTPGAVEAVLPIWEQFASNPGR